LQTDLVGAGRPIPLEVALEVENLVLRQQHGIQSVLALEVVVARRTADRAA